MKRRILGIGLVVVWGCALAYGMHAAMRYDSAPGIPGRPTASAKAPSSYWTCTMVLHPHCPCSRASLRALAEVAARNQNFVKVEIVFAWKDQPIKCDNADLAEQIPGATIRWVTPEKAEQDFGAFTSGQVLVFSPSGELAFSGGITPGRGIDQPRYAKDLFEQIISGERSESPVYGCPLQDTKL